MAKRLQLLLQDSEHREVQRIARSRGTSMTEWVRQALALACRHESLGDVDKKIQVIRAATQHDFPAEDLQSMLAEIERGQGTGQKLRKGHEDEEEGCS